MGSQIAFMLDFCEKVPGHTKKANAHFTETDEYYPNWINP